MQCDTTQAQPQPVGLIVVSPVSVPLCQRRNERPMHGRRLTNRNALSLRGSTPPPYRNPSTRMRLLPILSIVENSIVCSSGDNAAPYHGNFPSLTIVVRLPVPPSTKSIEVCSAD